MIDKEFAKLSIEKANLLMQEQTEEVKKKIAIIDNLLKTFSIKEQLAKS